ncbi:MAG TPA: hypothetical protein VD996_15395, partial [Chitinophagaceae bacterium]|nr:hypothetical protein [Chitinophagaceae bacterium]
MRQILTIAMLTILLSVTNAVHAGSGCGNDCKTKPPGCPCPKAGPNEFNVYTGNLHRETRDLDIWGGAGDTQLVWRRFYNSRNGWTPWTHAFHYTMTDEGLNSEGRPQLQVAHPEGQIITFVQSIGDPGIWLAPLGVGARLFQQGNNFFMQMENGYRYRFEKMSSVIYGTAYQLQDFRDPSQNLYTLTYDQWHNLLRVTEPAGRFFALTYAVIQGKLLITKVSTNDGRNVSYNYIVHNDGILDWVLLVSANYGDGTAANYTYAQSEPGRLMLLTHAVDSRLSGTAVNMRYTYQPNIAEGYIQEERNGITSEMMAKLSTIPEQRWICHPTGRVEHYIMPAGFFGAAKQYTDGLGRTTKWEYSDGGQGFMNSETDALGRTTSYVKSIYGNDLEITHSDGSKEKWGRDDLDLPLSYTDELGRVTIYTRDPLHRIVRITYPDGTNERFTYNSLGQVLTHTLRNGGIET